MVTVRVYNSAGELVKDLYGGAMEIDPQGFTLDQNIFLPGPANQIPPLVLGFPGRMLDGNTHLFWDGSNNDGQYIGPGTYYIKVESKDPFGKISAYTQPVQAAPKPAKRMLSIFNAAGELIWQLELGADYASPTLSDDPYAPEYDPSTGVATKALSIKMRDALGATYTEFWDGRNLLGQQVESGTYTLLLTESRLGGQISLETKNFQLLRSGTAKGVDSAGFDSNPTSKGMPLSLRYTPVMGRGLVAELYTLAGERVASFADLGASGKVSFGTDGLAPGIYMVVLREGLEKRVLKAAILN